MLGFFWVTPSLLRGCTRELGPRLVSMPTGENFGLWSSSAMRIVGFRYEKTGTNLKGMHNTNKI